MTTPAYSNSKDPFYQRDVFVAKKGQVVTPSDTTDLDNYTILYCTAAGTVSFLPVLNADGDPITLTVAVGWQSPWQVRRVLATGTSASFRTLEKF